MFPEPVTVMVGSDGAVPGFETLPAAVRLTGALAAMRFLVRSRVGDFFLENAHTPEELQALGEAAVEPPEKYLGSLFRYELPEARKNAFLHGLPTRIGEVLEAGKPIAVFSGDAFLGVGRFDKDESSLAAEKVYGVAE